MIPSAALSASNYARDTIHIKQKSIKLVVASELHTPKASVRQDNVLHTSEVSNNARYSCPIIGVNAGICLQDVERCLQDLIWKNVRREVVITSSMAMLEEKTALAG